MISTHARRLFVLVSLAAPLAAAHAAVDIPKEGRFDFNYCMAGKFDYTELRPGVGMGAWDLGAGTYANGGTKAFDRMGSYCVGAYEIVDGKYQDWHVCTMVDADGDKWLLRGQTGPDGTGKWIAASGTGKYEGMIANGTLGPVGEVPAARAPNTFNKCNRNTGTYKLR